MTEALGNNFFFDWEIRLMEWLQSAVGSEGPLLSILSSLSAFCGETQGFLLQAARTWAMIGKNRDRRRPP